MANKNEQELRKSVSEESVKQDDKSSVTVRVERDDRRAVEDDKSIVAKDDDSNGGDEDIGEEELDPWKEVDAEEINPYHRTTTGYRRAVSVFDPEDTRPQLAEHWCFVDPEIERDGHFQSA